jgi:hypothetical protein
VATPPSNLTKEIEVSKEVIQRKKIIDETLRGEKKKEISKGKSEEIFPFQRLNEKKKKMLRNANKRGLFGCCMGSKRRNFRLRRKNKKIGTVINMLENLYVEYDKKLIELLWHKKIFQPQETEKMRDDLTYFIPMIM